ncbi:BTAD domain-containing putative transcriptional regulator [Paractinoplanes rishiriensis]|uniref:SARP family transcriptional regulator n=1 Tax=Paractinoplanes rishiriensis TaxID=1050105 RepID=A0A919K6N8_9ACTN|nr:BTAD domain-containing putative transcriptional regulator [Actinoplanes rishiriensis]GIE97601.1 SARP family transcriptional regulator [Actinoplanes rishiriensis]
MTGSGFGAILRGLRIRTGLSQDELAQRSGLSVRAVRELESGRVARPQSRTVHRLVNALDLPPPDAQPLLTAVGAGDTAGFSVGILGPLSVRNGAVPVAVTRPKLKALLALLALKAGRAVPIDEIITVLWGEGAPLSASNQVQVYATQLRQLIEPDRGPGRPPDRVVRSADGYQLQLRDEESDAAAFRQAVAAQQHADGLGLWRGPVLADVAVLGSHPEAVALTRQRIDAALAFADRAADRDGYARAAQWLRELAHDEPLHEALAARLMLMLAATGEQAAALALYDRIRSRLGDELGVDPGDELQDAHLRVLRQQTGAAKPPAGPALAGPALVGPALVAPVPAQLPLGVRGFTGRDAAVAELDGLLGDLPSAVIITAVSGTAGVGKTSLAVHWAHRVAHHFPDGQLYADLRGFDHGGQITTPGEAVRGFLYALGVAPEKVPAEADAQTALYRSMLAGRRVLILLDNARDADQVRPLLPGTATAFTLVTSRNQLGGLVATHAARPLALDMLSAEEARHLLASRLGPERVEAEPDAVGDIVAACAHLPLALAIAAARAQQTTGSLASVASQLTARRLDALDAGDPASRIRAVFSWSYSALSPAAARLFRLLGLHPGPDLDAATASSLAGRDAATLLTELLDANLLTERVAGRYTFHDLLRAYAVEVLTDAEPEADRRAASHRLFDHYVHTAYVGDRQLSPDREPMPLPMGEPAEGVRPGRPATPQEAIDWCTAERGALLGVLRQAARTGFDTHAWQLGWCLDTYIHRRGNRQDLIEVWEIASEAADRMGLPDARGRARRGLAHAYLVLGKYDEAENQLQTSLDQAAAAGDAFSMAFTHRILAQVHWRRGDLHRALEHATLMLGMLREMDRPRWLAIALNAVGWYQALLGDYPAAIAHCTEALEVYRGMGSRFGQAKTLDSLGYAYSHSGSHDAGMRSYREAVAVFREVGDRYNEADTLTRLGDAHLLAADPRGAGACWRDALDILTDLDHPNALEVRAKLDRLDA